MKVQVGAFGSCLREVNTADTSGNSIQAVQDGDPIFVVLYGGTLNGGLGDFVVEDDEDFIANGEVKGYSGSVRVSLNLVHCYLRFEARSRESLEPD